MANAIANIPVTLLGGGCLLDISALIDISICPTLDIIKGSRPHKVHNEPQTICVTPSVSTPTVRPFLTSTLSTAIKATATSDPLRSYPVSGSQNGGTPAAYCSNPLVDVDLMLLGILDVDLSVYLDLSHLLDLDIDLNLGDLLSGKSKPKLPKSVKKEYKPTCGKTLANYPSANTTSCTATDYNACLARCEKDAIQATVKLGNLVDCLGVTIKNGIHVDNCLTVLGSSNNILDLDIDLLGSDDSSDSFVLQR